MGYWEEKQEYKEQLEEKDTRNKFCNVCGRPVTPKNIKGKCVECEEIICNSCGTIYNGKVTCADCKQVIKDNRTKVGIKKKKGYLYFIKKPFSDYAALLRKYSK